MKDNISISIEQKILRDLAETFPGEKRSQIIEKALEFWTMKKKKDQLRDDALKLMSAMAEAKELETELIEDGLNDL